MVKLKRAYQPASRSDGYRVLVERLWPRGVRKQDLSIHAWLKEIAPSQELRKWFGHDPERWPEFKRRYLSELKRGAAPQVLSELTRRAAQGTVTLIFAARDAEHNSAVVLRQALERVRQPDRRPAAGRKRKAD